MSLKSKAFVKRFIKGFLAGGFSSMAMIVREGSIVSNITELKTLGFVLLSAFITGSVLAVEKMLTWEEVQ